MIHFTYQKSLTGMEMLAHNMFVDRSKQFFSRLKWNVSVNEKGEERDEYDALNPLYIIVTNSDGQHQGSMRFLPTTGRTMINDHFTHLTNGVKIESPLIWECTRFCISDAADGRTSARLMAAGAKLMEEFGIEHFVGVFDRRMKFVYNLIGASPTIIGESGTGRNAICVGLWQFERSAYQNLLVKSELSQTEMNLFLANSDLGSSVQEAELFLDRIVA